MRLCIKSYRQFLQFTFTVCRSQGALTLTSMTYEYDNLQMLLVKYVEINQIKLNLNNIVIIDDALSHVKFRQRCFVLEKRYFVQLHFVMYIVFMCLW